jgi:hypothetical protein
VDDGTVWHLEGSHVQHLRQRIIEACNAITLGIIKRAFVDWVKRLNLCIENNGGHTEQIM